MMCDVRKADSDGMIKAFKKFEKVKPTSAWYDGRLSLSFKLSTSEFRILYISENSKNNAKCEYYPGVSNIRFDSFVNFNETMQKIIDEQIKNGCSNSILDYI